MQKKEKSKKCDKKCNTCSQTNCADDFRLACYGQKCQTCKLECSLKAAGGNRIKEIREEKYIQSGGKMRTDIGLIEELEIIAEDYTGQDIDPIRQARFDIARKLIFFYLEHPAEFDKFVLAFFCGKNQSDIAKERGVSRQSISKKIRTERHEEMKKQIDSLKKRNAAFATMTTNELKVYQICCIDGVFGASNIAKQAGISRWTVYRVLHRLSEKYGITATLDKSRKKNF